MRGAIPELASPDPLGRRLPAVYAADDLAQRLMSAYDEVIAPIYGTLDNLWAYLDPELTPVDFLDWLAVWVATDNAIDRPLDERRVAVKNAVHLHRRRGTVLGLREKVYAAFGTEPEIMESGATAWSSTPGTELPGSPEQTVTVRLRVSDPASVPLARLRALVDANRPAHVAYVVEVTPLAPADQADGSGR